MTIVRKRLPRIGKAANGSGSGESQPYQFARNKNRARFQGRKDEPRCEGISWRGLTVGPTAQSIAAGPEGKTIYSPTGLRAAGGIQLTSPSLKRSIAACSMSWGSHPRGHRSPSFTRLASAASWFPIMR